MELLPVQTELTPGVPTVVGNVDYQVFRETLEGIDAILVAGGVEREFVTLYVAEFSRKAKAAAERKGEVFKGLSAKTQLRLQEYAEKALRCNIARVWLDQSVRDFSIHLADSPLLQGFCRIARMDITRVPSKSTIDRYAKIVPEKIVRKVVNTLNRAATEETDEGPNALGLEEPLDLDAYFLDCTCVTANIHFPVDWVLLRDAARTLILAIARIRRHGLKHRMPAPSSLMKQMNDLAIAMTHSRRKRKAKRERKRILRLMKKLSHVIDEHARSYREMLQERWTETDLKEGHVRQILQQIDNVRAQLPEAISQAHERIIGGRRVPNEKKILSLYDPDIHVIVRGKAGAEVEFGNTLLLGEQRHGLIIDWRLFKDTAPNDSRLLPESLERIREVFDGRVPGAVATDRGFDSSQNASDLDRDGIFNAVASKSSAQLRERTQDPRFRQLQKRRAQTEGRIGIFKRNFLGNPMRAKGFINRESRISWAVLTHNLWVVSRRRTAEAAARHKEAA